MCSLPTIFISRILCCKFFHVKAGKSLFGFNSPTRKIHIYVTDALQGSCPSVQLWGLCVCCHLPLQIKLRTHHCCPCGSLRPPCLPRCCCPFQNTYVCWRLVCPLVRSFHGSKDLVIFASRRHSAIPVSKIAIGSSLV